MGMAEDLSSKSHDCPYRGDQYPHCVLSLALRIKALEVQLLATDKGLS